MDFLRGFRLVLFPIFGFARRSADMGAENIQRCLTKTLGILRQMEEFVGPAQAHGIRPMSQSARWRFSGAPAAVPFSAFSLALACSVVALGLRVRRVLHRLSPDVGQHRLNGEQEYRPCQYPEISEFRFSWD